MEPIRSKVNIEKTSWIRSNSEIMKLVKAFDQLS